MKLLEQTPTPSYIAVVGKLRLYGGDRINVAVEPESIAVVDGEPGEAWLVKAVEHTRNRIIGFENGETMAVQVTRQYGDKEVKLIESAVANGAAELGIETGGQSGGEDVPTPLLWG